MNTALKRALSVLMVFTMLVGMLPANVFADTSNDLQIGGPADIEGPVKPDPEEESETVELKDVNVTVTPGTVTMQSTDGVRTLTAAVDGAASPEVTWSIVSGEDIITLEGHGLKASVKPKSFDVEGEAVVRASYPGDEETKAAYADCVVTVTLGQGSVIVMPSQISMFSTSLGADLTASVLPEALSQEVTWTSSAPEVAAVDANGHVTPVGVGTATITATAQDIAAGSTVEDHCTVTVKEVKYRVDYNSNYPADAKKFAYKNGNKDVNKDSSPLVPAVDTNAVYEVVGGQEHTVIEGMTCANYNFIGWSREPGAATPDADCAPGSVITVNDNQTFYAVWQKNSATEAKRISIVYRYVNSAKKTTTNTRSATAYLVGQDAEGRDLYSFQLGNCADGLGTAAGNDKTVRGWIVDGTNYNFNAVCTTTLDENNKVYADAWQDDSLVGDEAFAQFFVHKYRVNPSSGTPGVATVDYYSVGTGKVNVALSKEKDRVGGNVTDDVSEYLVETPSNAQIASALEIPLSDTENIRWFKVVKANDGYHVDGIIYSINKNWTVKFIDPLAGGKVIRSVAVEDKGALPTLPAGPSHADAEFECWVDEAGKPITSISVVIQDRTLTAKYKDKVMLSGIIDHGTVTNSPQEVISGHKTTAMVFTADENYTITSVLVNNKAQTIKSGLTTYTYPSKSLTVDTLVIVNTKGADAVIRFDANGGTGAPNDLKGAFGETIGDPFPSKQPTRPGYTFGGWYTTPDGGSKVTSYPARFEQLETVYYAHWVPAAVKYTVEYYYQADGTYPAAADSSAERTGATETTVSATDADKTPAKSGYAFDSTAAGNVLTGVVKADGTLVLKVYFKQQFTVAYKKGEHGTFTETSHSGLDFNAATPEAPKPTGEAGYQFAGWRDAQGNAPAEKVTGDAVYTAQWTLKTDAGYKVHYYLLGTKTKVAEDKVVADATYGKEYPENAVTAAGYEVAGDKTQKVIANYDNNEITFYYYKNVTVTGNSYSVKYTGKPFAEELKAAVEGTLDGDKLTYSVAIAEGEAIAVGTYAVTPSGDGVQGYYKVQYVPGNLTITAAELTARIIGSTVTKTYNGEAQSAAISADTGYQVEAPASALFDAAKVTYSGTASVSGTDAGAYAMNLTAADFSYSDSNLKVTFEIVNDGSLVIEPKTVALVSQSGTWDYDGEAHGKPEVSGKEEIYARDELTVSAAATVKEAGESKTNTITVTGSETALKNYSFQKTEGTLTIEKTALSLTVTNYRDTYDGNAHGTAAVPSVTKDTTVSYSVDNGGTWTTEVPTVTNVADGVITVKVKAENPNYYPAEASYTLEVLAKSVTITVNDAAKVYGEADPAFTGTVNGLVKDGDLGKITYKRTNTDENVGTYEDVLTAEYTANTNYSVKVEKGDFEITKAALTITDPGYTGTYDGETHGPAAVPSVTEGTKVTYSTDGGETWTDEVPTITNVADGPINVIAKAENPNYEDATVEYTLKLTAKEVTVTVNDSTSIYGEALDAFTAVVDGVIGRDTVDYTITRDSDSMDAGQYVLNAIGEENQGNYHVTYVPGTLTIDRREITLTSESDTKVYDGKPLTKDGVTVTSGSFPEGESFTYKMTGKQTDAGESRNTFDVIFPEGTKESNYNITKNPGTLIVTPYDEEIVIEIIGNSTIQRYNGRTVTVEGFEVNIDPDIPLDPESITLKDGITSEISRINVGTTNMGLDEDDFINNDPNFTNVRFEVKDGFVTVTPAPVVVTADAQTKVYGEELDPFTASVSGLLDGQKLDYTVVKTNDSMNAGTYELAVTGSSSQGNYNVTFVPGTLVITPRTLNITAESQTWEYDGDVHTLDAYTVGEGDLVYGDTVAAVTVTGSVQYAGKPESNVPSDAVVNTGSADNYRIAYHPGTLNVVDRSNKYQVELVAANGTAVYNGTVQRVEGFSLNVTGGGSFFAQLLGGASVNGLTFTADGNTYTVTGITASAERTDAGMADVTFSGSVVILDANGTDVSNQFNVTTTNGTFEITKRTVVLQSASDAKTYDGTPLTNDTVIIGGVDGFVPGEEAGLTILVTGSQTEVGTSDNTFTYALDETTAKSANYDIQMINGVLTVTPAPIYTLTIHYQYENGTPAADDFVGQFVEGQTYLIYSPVINGFEPDFLFITSGNNGMPGTDLTLVVTYYEEDVPNDPPTIPNTPEVPQEPDGDTPRTPNGGVIEENPEKPGTYELIPIVEDDVPLAQGGGHVDDIAHFLLIGAAAIVEFVYFHKRKKYQEEIFELKKKLGDTSMDEE